MAQKKIGRNKDWCKAYRLTGKREKNKKLKIQKHLESHPGDIAAAAQLKALKPRNSGNSNPKKGSK